MAKGPLGKFVAERRKALNLRQSDLADALGYTTQAISKFEAGESQIAIAVLPNLANLLHLSIDDLFAQSIPSEPVTKKNEKIDGALVATNLATLRKLNHLSLSEEASIAEVSKRTIIHYERGDSAPSFDVLDRLLSHFNVTPSLFFYSVLKSPEVSPTVLSEKPKSKKKWLIPVIVLLLIALATGITVPLVLQNQKAQKPGTNSSVPVISASESTVSSQSSETSSSSQFSVPTEDLSSDFPGLKALLIAIDGSTVQKELAIGTHPIVLTPYPADYFNDTNYTISYSLNNVYIDQTTIEGTGTLSGRNLVIGEQEYGDDATNGVVITLTNQSSQKTYQLAHYFSLYQPKVLDQTSFPNIITAFARNGETQFIEAKVGETFEMEFQAVMKEGTTFDPALYSITRTNGTEFQYQSQTGTGTDHLVLTYKVIKIPSSYFDTASFIITNNQTYAKFYSRFLRIHVPS
jgi:transcriptional regulator with XRE-family HTH domain